MKKEKKNWLVSRILLPLICLVFVSAISHAQLKLESVNPNLGQLGRNLEVTLNGSDFDASTRISMFLDAGNVRAIIGSVETPGLALGLAVADGRAYVADWHKGLQIIDISNPRNPQIIGSVVTPGFSAKDVAVAGTIAYVANGDNGLQLIDISDPANPMIIGSVITPGYAEGVAVSGAKAYVADGIGGLQIIDIVIPTNPRITGAVDTPDYAKGVAVAGTTAYVADGVSGLQLIDISDPTNPWIVGSVDTPGNVQDVSIAGDRAYLADRDGGLQLIDISNPTSPWIIGSVDTPGYADSVAVAGERAYVANGGKGLLVIDISNPTSPRIIGAVDTPYTAGVVTVAGDQAFVAGWDSAVLVIDISNPASPQIHGAVDTPDKTRGIAVAGNRAYVADRDSGLQVIDISNSTSPRILGAADTPGFAWAVTVAGARAYVADFHEGLQIIDISNSTNPQIVGSVDTPGYAQGVTVAGPTAYVADGGFGLQLIDISNSTNPQIVGSVATPGNAQGVAVAGATAYVADGEFGLQLIDISDPQNPWIVGSVDTPGNAQGVAVTGAKAYVADGYQRFQVVDISDPQSPWIVGSADIPGYAWGVTVAGDRAYVAADSGGHLVIDISNPTRPQITGAVGTPGNAIETRVLGDKVYIADDLYGLVIVPLPVEIQSFIVVSENRISSTLPSPITAGYYTLMIFNESQSDKFMGAVTFLPSEDYQQLVEKKAIIVAGYRSYPSDSLWDKTKLNTNLAYLSLLTQGYNGANIYYLSPEPVDLDGDGQNDVDADTNMLNLSYAIRTWAHSTPELLLYMTDHGGSGSFQLNQNQILDANILDDWLDELQPTVSERIIVVYDACKSGSFIPLLTPPAGKERIVITSTTADEYAWFVNDGVLSFSYQFWAYLQLNAYLVRAFNTAGDMMGNDQTALMDANGNGVPNEKEDNIADIVIGRGRVAASTPPVVGQVSGKQILNGEISASFWARHVGGLNPVVQVWAVIIPPGDRPADDPIIDFSKVDLLDGDQDGIYEAVYNGFTSVGTYQVLVYAKDEDNAISRPQEIIVSQTAADRHEDDDTFRQANAIVLNDPNSQLHNFHDDGDADWVKFYGLSGETYTIEAYNLGDNCDAVIEVYDTDGTTLLDEQDTIGDPNADERLDWSCAQDGIYYVKIKHYSATVFGDGSEYDLKVYRPIAPFPGIIIGMVSETLFGQEIPDVKLSTGAGASALSLIDGRYVMVHPAGTFSVTAQKAGYHPKTILGVQINENEVTILNCVITTFSEDTDGDGIPDAVENDAPCLDALDADTDDDGISDGAEYYRETDPCDIDTDGDGLQDGMELGLTSADIGDDTDEGVFQPDLDSTTTTDPLDNDTDDDGRLDGEEDSNHNGRVDPGETEPHQFDGSGLPWLMLLLFEE